MTKVLKKTAEVSALCYPDLGTRVFTVEVTPERVIITTFDYAIEGSLIQFNYGVLSPPFIAQRLKKAKLVSDDLMHVVAEELCDIIRELSSPWWHDRRKT